MHKLESLSHTEWDCKHHDVFIPKCQKANAVHSGEAAPWRGVTEAGGVEGVPGRGGALDVGLHGWKMLPILPKYAVSQVLGFIKGNSAIHLARVYGECKRNFVGQYFWARVTSSRR
jgi:putative transposase